MEPHIIKRYIDRDAAERARRLKLRAYYRTENPILGRTLDTTKPNNRIAHAYARLIATSYAGYMFGNPVTYQGDDARLMEQLDACYKYNDEQAENAALGLDLAIYGAAAELLYVDGDGEVRFRRIDPVGVIGVYDDTIEQQLTEVIRYYELYDIANDRSYRRVEVLDRELWSTYNMFGGALELIEEHPHGFGDVPAVLYRNNEEGMGDFEPVLTLIDAYDKMQSESLNDQEYFSDAYLLLRGIGDVSAEDLSEMKRNRAILLPPDGDASFLIKSNPDSKTEEIKDRLNSDIHRFSGCPDMSDENFAGNASGVAMKYKLLQFENIASTKEREFKRGLQRRIELLCNIWATLGRGSFDWRAAEIAFHRSLPENLLELSQTLANLGDLLSDETRRSLLPLDIDEEAEVQRIADEREEGLAYQAAIFGSRSSEDDSSGDDNSDTTSTAFGA